GVDLDVIGAVREVIVRGCAKLDVVVARRGHIDRVGEPLARHEIFHDVGSRIGRVVGDEYVHAVVPAVIGVSLITDGRIVITAAFPTAVETRDLDDGGNRGGG